MNGKNRLMNFADILVGAASLSPTELKSCSSQDRVRSTGEESKKRMVTIDSKDWMDKVQENTIIAVRAQDSEDEHSKIQLNRHIFKSNCCQANNERRIVSASSEPDNSTPADPNSSSIKTIRHENYQDHSKKAVNNIANGSLLHTDEKKKGGIKILFPEKLHKFLCSDTCAKHASVIGWAPHGRSFIVRNPEKFINEITPLIFNHSTMASFQRQLNLYGFKRITRTGSRDEGAYYHEMFLRGRPDLCLLMRRKKIKGAQSKPIQIPTDEPDFYKMEPCNGIGNNLSSPNLLSHEEYIQNMSKIMNQTSLINAIPSVSSSINHTSELLYKNFNGNSPLLQQALMKQKYYALFSNMNSISSACLASGLCESELLQLSQSSDVSEILGKRNIQLPNVSDSLLQNVLLNRQQQEKSAYLSALSLHHGLNFCRSLQLSERDDKFTHSLHNTYLESMNDASSHYY